MPLPKPSPPPANSSIPRPAATIWSRRRSRHETSNAGYQLHITGLLKPGLVRPGFVILAGAFRPILHKTYWEMGGAGGPAGAIGGGGGTEAVTAGAAGCTAGAGGSDADSGVPLETAADTAGAAGAGVTGGTGSGRNTGLSLLPVSFGVSILASEVPPPDGLAPSVLAPSVLAVSLVEASPFPASPFGASSLPASGFAASVLAASVLAASDLGGSSLPGPPRLLSFALAASGASPGRASRLALRPSCPGSARGESPLASGLATGRGSPPGPRPHDRALVVRSCRCSMVAHLVRARRTCATAGELTNSTTS